MIGALIPEPEIESSRLLSIETEEGVGVADSPAGFFKTFLAFQIHGRLLQTNRASRADNSRKRSLKYGFADIVSPDSFDFLHHLPGGGEDPFRPDSLPELLVEAPVVFFAGPQNSRHDDLLTLCHDAMIS